MAADVCDGTERVVKEVWEAGGSDQGFLHSAAAVCAEQDQINALLFAPPHTRTPPAST